MPSKKKSSASKPETPSTPDPIPDEAVLRGMRHRPLQHLAKQYGIKPLRVAASVLVDKLLAIRNENEPTPNQQSEEDVDEPLAIDEAVPPASPVDASETTPSAAPLDDTTEQAMAEPSPSPVPSATSTPSPVVPEVVQLTQEPSTVEVEAASDTDIDMLSTIPRQEHNDGDLDEVLGDLLASRPASMNDGGLTEIEAAVLGGSASVEPVAQTTCPDGQTTDRAHDRSRSPQNVATRLSYGTAGGPDTATPVVQQTSDEQPGQSEVPESPHPGDMAVEVTSQSLHAIQSPSVDDSPADSICPPSPCEGDASTRSLLCRLDDESSYESDEDGESVWPPEDTIVVDRFGRCWVPS
jgi:hypothetical protein